MNFALLFLLLVAAIVVRRARNMNYWYPERTGVALRYVALRWLLLVGSIWFTIAAIQSDLFRIQAQNVSLWLLYGLMLLLWWAQAALCSAETSHHTAVYLGAILLRVAYAAVAVVLVLEILGLPLPLPEPIPLSVSE